MQPLRAGECPVVVSRWEGPPAFEDFVRGRHAALLRFGNVLCGDPHLAADLVQDALERTGMACRGSSLRTIRKGMSDARWSTGSYVVPNRFDAVNVTINPPSRRVGGPTSGTRSPSPTTSRCCRSRPARSTARHWVQSRIPTDSTAAHRSSPMATPGLRCGCPSPPICRRVRATSTGSSTSRAWSPTPEMGPRSTSSNWLRIEPATTA
jgi:hypothetical protein